MTTVLIIEDESDLRRGLETRLAREGYSVKGAGDGESGLALAEKERPDIILLDVMLPGIDGLEVCRRLRQKNIHIPIIMLTARSEEVDRVVGLEVGADDYVVKPFSVRELIARIRARLRERSRVEEAPQTYRLGDVEVDFQHFIATRAGEPVPLTGKEFEILRLLASKSGDVVTRQEMLSQIWGYHPEATTRTVDTHILRLRQKIEKDPANPRHIQTVYGSGYRLVD